MHEQCADLMNEIVNGNQFEPSPGLTIMVMALLDRYSESTKMIVSLRRGISADDNRNHTWKNISEHLNKHYDTQQFTVSRCEKKYRDFRRTFHQALQLHEIGEIAKDIMRSLRKGTR